MTPDDTERVVDFWVAWCQGPRSTLAPEHFDDDRDMGCQLIRSDPDYWETHRMTDLAQLVREEREALS